MRARWLGVRWPLPLLLLAACATTRPCAEECAWHRSPYAVVDDWTLRDPLPDDILVRFDHGGFLEGCPFWTFVVFTDGRVEYEGVQHVRIRERRSGNLDPDELTKLRRLLADLPDHSYDRDYFTHSGWGSTDCAFARTLSYRTAGSEPRVFRHYIDGDRYAPLCLRHLEYRIVARAGVLRWTGRDPFGDVPRPLGTADVLTAYSGLDHASPDEASGPADTAGYRTLDER